jgi:predicted metalloendopeptidase
MRTTTLFRLLPLLAAGCWHARPPASLPSAVFEGTSRLAAPGSAPVAPATGARATAAPDVLAALDPGVSPCDDFYQYACGGWLKRTELPADQTRWGRAFSVINERNRDVLRGILEGPAPASATEQAKMHDYYRACMDEDAIERAGTRPLAPLLAEIDRVDSTRALVALAGQMHRLGAGVLFGMRVGNDYKDPEKTILHLGQGGLGMPDRDYYLKDDEKSVAIRVDYEKHVAAMLGLSGLGKADAAAAAAKIVAFETELARVSLPRAELRDPEKVYHKLDLGGLKTLAPGLDWDAFLLSTGGAGVTDINVAVPGFVSGLEAILGRTPPETTRAYLRWHLVHDLVEHLPRAFVEEDFRFFGQRLRGQKELKARWKRCVDATDDALGELLGQAFVERQFPGDSKTIALGMIQGIEAAFAAALPDLRWMDPATRERAMEKMRAIGNKIGYPDAWRDYAKLQVTPVGFFDNGLAAKRFEHDRELAQVGQPVDRKEWRMTPPTVNAYYNPLFNEMAFPAGILQPPFFDRGFPMAMNFGGIGMVMGHELTHGFDDSGRKFDARGRMIEWWEPEVARRFETAAQCVDDLYASYEPQPGLKLNGKLTLGENLADLGGIRQAYRAYREWAKTNGPEAGVEGLSGDQLFFVAFAQTWCSLITPEEERVRVTTDSHSPARFRVNGPVSNFPAFAAVFACSEGSPMRRANPCEVW